MREAINGLLKKTSSRLKKMDNLREQIKLIEVELSKLHNRSYKEEVFIPLAKALLPFTYRKKVEVMGPFGLGCHYSIIFYDGKDWVKDIKSKSITLSPSFGTNVVRLFVVDERKDTGKYSKESLGYANGMHHPTYEIPSDMTFKEIVDKWINKRSRKV